MAVMLAHAFCNWCGLPRVWGRVGRDVERRGKRDARGARGAGGAPRRGVGIGWSIAYYVILVAGVVGFQRGLWPLTESKGRLAQVG